MMKRLTALLLAVLMGIAAVSAVFGEEAEHIWRKGDTGEKVSWIQQRLIDLGYLEGESTGVFDEATEAIAERSAKGERLAGFIRMLEAQREPVAEFDERLWGAMVDYVTVGADKRLTVVFRDGTGGTHL